MGEGGGARQERDEMKIHSDPYPQKEENGRDSKMNNNMQGAFLKKKKTLPKRNKNANSLKTWPTQKKNAAKNTG